MFPVTSPLNSLCISPSLTISSSLRSLHLHSSSFASVIQVIASVNLLKPSSVTYARTFSATAVYKVFTDVSLSGGTEGMIMESSPTTSF